MAHKKLLSEEKIGHNAILWKLNIDKHAEAAQVTAKPCVNRYFFAQSKRAACRKETEIIV